MCISYFFFHNIIIKIQKRDKTMTKKFKNVKIRMILPVFLFIAMISISTPPIQEYSADNDLTIAPTAQYTSSAPIKIESVSDFASFPGSGTINNPYIISGYEIMSNSSSSALTFVSVSEYVVVSNCKFITNGTTGHAAIYMHNSSLITVVNCIVDVINKLDGGFGIKLRNSSDIQIIGCEISNVYYMYGVEIFTNCSNILVKGNIIKGCWDGIASGMIVGGGNCANLSVIGNHITQCNSGILFRDVVNTTIRDNYIAKLDNKYIDTENCTEVSRIDNTIIRKFLYMDITLSDVSLQNREILLVAEPIDGFGPFTYQWNFNDTSANETSKSVKHVYSEAGIYNITVTATDIDGEAVTRGYQIEITAEEGEGNNIIGYIIGAIIAISIIGIVIIWRMSIKKKKTKTINSKKG